MSIAWEPKPSAEEPRASGLVWTCARGAELDAACAKYLGQRPGPMAGHKHIAAKDRPNCKRCGGFCRSHGHIKDGRRQWKCVRCRHQFITEAASL